MSFFRRESTPSKIPGEIFVGKHPSYYKRDKVFDKDFYKYIVPWRTFFSLGLSSRRPVKNHQDLSSSTQLL